MLARSLVFRQIFRFCTKGQTTQPATSGTSSALLQAEKRLNQGTPLHLRPYDAKKYEVPMKKIKRNSGYALIQIEPFPRARIMKICYNILAQLRKEIPEEFPIRLFLEERTKFYMDIVDKTEDVTIIQRILARGMPVQIIIRNLADQLDFIKVLRTSRVWEKEKQFQQQFQKDFVERHEQFRHHANPQYKKGERPKTPFV